MWGRSVRVASAAVLVVVLAGIAASVALAVPPAPSTRLPNAPNCPIFPAKNVWNKPVDTLPVAANSATMINAIGANVGLHPDFGSFAGYGIPINVVTRNQVTHRVRFLYKSESNHVPYPIPAHPKIEAGSDRHMLIVNRGTCRLYELYAVRHTATGWHAGSGAVWALTSNHLRPNGWTSADAAGLPILPGLVRHNEVKAGGVAEARRDRSRPALHGAAHVQRSHLPGPSRCRLGQLCQLAADGAARAPEGVVQPGRAAAPGAGDRNRPEAVRDDPGRQRLALVHLRLLQPALQRLGAAPAEPNPRQRPRGGRHLGPAQRLTPAEAVG
jgi:hypothetical protein